jgi:hypothetical protein
MNQTVILDYPPRGGAPGQLDCEGKFLQLVLRGQEYLLFAPRALHRFHYQILARFLAEHAIPYRWVSEQALEVNAPELAVIGGGKFRVRAKDRTLELWDNSQAYGRFDERELPEKIASAGHRWSRFAVRIS